MAGVAGTWLGSIPTFPRRAAPWYLIPMDDVQSDHLKAYGVTYRVLGAGQPGGMVPQLSRRIVPGSG